MEPRLIADYACGCGEGPLWHPEEKRVYWIDIDAGRMFRYDPETSAHEQVYEGTTIGGFTLQADGSLLLFMDKGAVKVWRDGAVAETILPELAGERQSRFNDVIADPAGRVFCGTMSSPERPGRLYRLDPDGSIRVVLDGVKTSNGMGFTPDLKGLYHIDSPTRQVRLFDYDEATGELANRRVFVTTPEGEGVPDGMTVDAEGCLWVAKWNGGCLVRYTPDGQEERRIPFPAKKVSCVTFGGEDYADMYVTTAGGTDKPNEGPGAGALFHLTAGVRGVPEFRSHVGL